MADVSKNDVFTAYVRDLAPDDPSGVQPELERERFDEVREHLRAILVTEMRRRGLWTSPPSYLGVEAAAWTERGALDELVSDAYVFTFVQRLRALADKLKVRSNIRGLVVRNVRNLLTDRQRQGDPLGYRVFTRLRKAVEQCLELGKLFVRGWFGKEKELPAVDNSTVLAFSRQPAPVAEARQLESPVDRWVDRLMPDLVGAEGRAVPKVVDRVADEVQTLPTDGVEAFRLEHVAKPLKQGARRRWQALWQQERGEVGPVDGTPGAPEVAIERPEETPDQQRYHATILTCIEQRIDALTPAKLQRQMWQLWLYVRGSGFDFEQSRELPSYSEIGRELDLPRERVAQLLGQLRTLVDECLQGADGADSQSSPHHGRSTEPSHASEPATHRRNGSAATGRRES